MRSVLTRLLRLSDSVYKAVRHSNVSLNSLFERYIIYSPTFIKIIVRKDKIPLSIMWICLEKLKEMTDRVYATTSTMQQKESYLITRFLFREMNVEDVLACIISNSHAGVT